MTEEGVPEWLALLQSRLNDSNVTITALAAQIGVARSTLSAIIKRCPSSPYVKGTASTANIERKVVAALGRYVCPHLSEVNESEEWVSGEYCRTKAHRPAPTWNPVEIAHWQACKSCTKRPPEIVKKVPVLRGPKKKVEPERDESQQEFEI